MQLCHGYMLVARMCKELLALGAGEASQRVRAGMGMCAVQPFTSLGIPGKHLPCIKLRRRWRS